jgi:hypothetical protein
MPRKRRRSSQIDSYEELLAFASSLRISNIQAGRLAADVLADGSKRTYAGAEGDVAIITPPIDSDPIGQGAKGFNQVATKYGALDVVAHNRPTRDSVQ